MNKRQQEWSSQKGDAFSRFSENIGKMLSGSGSAKREKAGKAAKGKKSKGK